MSSFSDMTTNTTAWIQMHWLCPILSLRYTSTGPLQLNHFIFGVKRLMSSVHTSFRCHVWMLFNLEYGTNMKWQSMLVAGSWEWIPALYSVGKALLFLNNIHNQMIHFPYEWNVFKENSVTWLNALVSYSVLRKVVLCIHKVMKANLSLYFSHQALHHEDVCGNGCIGTHFLDFDY
jgi:hypothetical protein